MRFIKIEHSYLQSWTLCERKSSEKLFLYQRHTMTCNIPVETLASHTWQRTIDVKAEEKAH